MAYYREGNFLSNIPPVTRNLLIINVLVWLVCFVSGARGSYLIVNILGLHAVQMQGFYLFQLVTFMFTHVQFMHLFFNMFALFMFGPWIERTWGPKRFLTYYLITGIGSGVVQLAVQFFLGGMAVTIGASGAVFGLLLAFGMLFPNAPIYVMFVPIPIKAKYMVIGYGVLELFLGVGQVAGDNVAHFAHLGGMLFGIVLILYWRKRGGGYGGGFY
jgi:membrane associated rhomboid family serine protease